MIVPGPPGAIRSQARPRPEFHQLEVFLAVVEAGTFSAAARQLGRSQPAVSQAIGRLEEMYGSKLFQRRSGAPLLLTPIAQAILPSARMLLHTIDEQMARAAELGDQQRGTLSVGFYPGFASGNLRQGLADFIAAHPEVRLRLVERPPTNLHRQFNDGAIDLMIVALMPDLANTTLVQEALWKERLVVALPEDHPLASHSALEWNDIASLPLLLSTAQCELVAFRALLTRAGDHLLDCEQHDVSEATLRDMVAMGLGATITFESAVAPRPGVAVRPIAGDQGLITVEGIRRRGGYDPIRHKLLACIRKHVAIRQPA